MNQPAPDQPRLPLPTTPSDLFKVFQSLGIHYTLYNHEPVFRVQDGEHLKRDIPALHCRNLFLCDKKKVMYLVVAANETAIDMKKLEPLIGSSRLSFGSPDRLWTYLGIYPGAVCPFTVINDKEHQVNVILEAAMMAANPVAYHPLDNAMTISLSPDDLLKFFAYTGHTPKILDLSAAAPT